MSSQAYLVVEGPTDAAIVGAALPPDLRGEVVMTAASDRSNLTSLARTLLVTRRKPVAVLLDTDSVDERTIHDRVQSTQELLKAVAAGTMTKVIPLISSIEAVFFAADVLTRASGSPLPEEVRLLARTSPKEALERLLAQPIGFKNIQVLLDHLTDEEMAALRATPPLQELIAFLGGVVKPQVKHSIV